MATKKKQTQDKKTSSFGKQKRKNTGKIKGAKDEAIIDSRAKTDIVAVVLIVIGAALLAVALVPTDAPVTSLIVNALRFVVGVGVYIFPFALII